MISVFICTKIFELEFVFIFKFNLIITIIFSSFGLFLIRKHLVFPSSLFLPKKFILYAIPMGLIVILASVSPFIERSLILHYIDKESMGYYSAAAKISMLILIPVTAFQAGFSPFIMANYRVTDIAITFNCLLKLFIYLIGIYLILVTSFSGFLINVIVSEKYYSSEELVLPLSLSMFLQSVGFFLGIGTVITTKTYYRLITFVISLSVTIFLIAILAPKYSVFGVSVSVLIGKSIFFVLESFFGQRLHPIDWDYSRSFILLITPVIFSFILATKNLSNMVLVSVVSIFFLFYSISLFLFLDKNEKLSLVSLARAIANR